MASPPHGFEFREAGNGVVIITQWGREAATLRGRVARNLLAEVESVADCLTLDGLTSDTIVVCQ